MQNRKRLLVLKREEQMITEVVWLVDNNITVHVPYTRMCDDYFRSVAVPEMNKNTVVSYLIYKLARKRGRARVPQRRGQGIHRGISPQMPQIAPKHK